jgi:hypothetical protein
MAGMAAHDCTDCAASVTAVGVEDLRRRVHTGLVRRSRAVGNAALESVAIGAIVAVVYAWSFRTNVHEFNGVLYGPTTYLATAMMVWLFDNIEFQGRASISVLDWVDLGVSLAVAASATMVSAIRICAQGDVRAAAIARRSAEQIPQPVWTVRFSRRATGGDRR